MHGCYLFSTLKLTSMKQRGSRILQDEHVSMGHTFAMLAYEFNIKLDKINGRKQYLRNVWTIWCMFLAAIFHICFLNCFGSVTHALYT